MTEEKSICSKCGGELHPHDKDDIVSSPMVCGYCERGEENPDKPKKEEMIDVTDKEIEEFMVKMKQRLLMGREKYPNQLMKQNIVKEWEEEIIDLANYGILLYGKLKRLEKEIKKEYVAYAYLCKECCTILEMPCFIDGKCPECRSELKDILYLRK